MSLRMNIELSESHGNRHTQRRETFSWPVKLSAAATTTAAAAATTTAAAAAAATTAAADGLDRETGAEV